jgi:hypothetical protein
MYVVLCEGLTLHVQRSIREVERSKSNSNQGGESIYIDSNMGHAYLTAEGHTEATVLALCTSAEDLMANQG